MVAARIDYQEDRLIVSGDLNFSSVVDLWKQSLLLFPRCKALQIDLSGVTSSNSAGLALLLEWIKYAKEQQKLLAFSHVPAQLNSIAVAVGIDKHLYSLS